MKFSVDKTDRYTHFILNEENLNSTVAPQLKSELVIFRNEGVENFIFDLSNVKYIDSSGLSAILTAYRLWKDGGTAVMTGVKSDMVRKLIEISRLDTILAIVPTLEESIDYVMMSELERELKAEADTDDTMQ